MKISWNGDNANSPKVGVVVANENGNYYVEWNDGTKMIVPSFTVNPRYGWSIENVG